APVELLDGAVETERPLLDQVEERHAEAAIALRDRDDEAEVRLDHPPLRSRVAALDRLREDHLVRGGEQLVLADVREEQLQAVAGAADRSRSLGRRELGFLLRLPLLLRLGDRRRARDLQADALELRGEILDVLVVEVQLDTEGFQLGRIEVAALLRALDHRPRLVSLEQLVELVLRQGLLSPFRGASTVRATFSP